MFFSFFISIFFVFIYTLVFYFSANTPLNDANLAAIFDVLGMTVTISLLVSLIIFIIFFAAKKLSNNNQKLVELAEKITVFFILFVGFLLLAENWSYSLFSKALKTDDSSLLKIIFLLVAAFLSHQFTPGAIKLARVLEKNKILFFSLTLPISIFIISNNLYGRFSTEKIEEGTQNISDKYNVVILSSDGINAAEMSIYGSEYLTTPFLSSIEDEFMVFENAYSNNNNTTGSIISTLTGILPLTTKVVYPPDILKGADSLRSVPKILGDAGYYRTLWAVPHYADASSQNMISAFEVNNSYSDSDLVEVYGFLKLKSLQRWYLYRTIADLTGVLADALFIKELDNPFSQVDHGSSVSNQSPHSLNDETRLKNVLQDIDAAVLADKPFFIMTHFMASHGARFRPKNNVFSKGIDQTQEWMPEYYRDSIIDYDQAIKEVYSKLKDSQQLENTILIITSDHGIRYDNKNRIPILIRLPDAQKSGKFIQNVQLIDIAPTILNTLGIEIPKWMEGDSLLSPELIDANRYIFITGVRYNKAAGKVWIREAKEDKSFSSSNIYSVIYCDYFMKSAYPINFSPAPLIDHVTGMPCGEESLALIANKAQAFIEAKLTP